MLLATNEEVKSTIYHGTSATLEFVRY